MSTEDEKGIRLAYKRLEKGANETERLDKTYITLELYTKSRFQLHCRLNQDCRTMLH